MAKFCHECGQPLTEGAKFCAECGSRVTEPNDNSSVDVNISRDVSGSLAVAGRDIIIGRDEHEEHCQKVLNWNKKDSLRSLDLSDGDFSGLELVGADLQGSSFINANINNTDLWKANLRNTTNLTDLQLSRARSLRAAIMPDGKIYNGRFNLKGDLQRARDPFYKIDTHDPAAMARFYKVSLKEYQDGQEWALNNP